jgi:hypothetical protein
VEKVRKKGGLGYKLDRMRKTWVEARGGGGERERKTGGFGENVDLGQEVLV